MNVSPQFVDSEPGRDVPPERRDVSRQSPPTINPAGVKQVSVPPKRSLRVLCIDDDQQVLESLIAFLVFFKHRVKAASGGKRGIELFCAARLAGEPYDVVVTDLTMPEVDGYEVARQIKAESPDTPVIMMSGLGLIAKEEAGSRLVLVDAVVNKPPRPRELNDLLLRMARPAPDR
jgi:CheY-like chemotaxis protein